MDVSTVLGSRWAFCDHFSVSICYGNLDTFFSIWGQCFFCNQIKCQTFSESFGLIESIVVVDFSNINFN